MSEALKSNNTLETLELNNNMIGVAGAQSLASMLQVNRALTSLDLSINEIGVGGAQAIANSLPQSVLQRLTINVVLDIEQLKTSTSVDLSGRCIIVEEAIIVAKCMEFNRALNSVDLRDTTIPGAGKQQLRDAVKGKNMTLQL